MKYFNCKDVEIIQYEAKKYQLDIDMTTTARLVEYLDFVLQANEHINLTAITTPSKALILHILDSLLLLPSLTQSSTHTVLDMGTGAGFPGVLIALCTPCYVDAVDSVCKKISCIQEIVHAMNIKNCSPYFSRLEDFALTHRAAYDVVTARALASTDVLMEYAEPLLKENGRLIITKAPLHDDELEKIEIVRKLLGFTLEAQYDYQLPNNLGERSIITYKKEFSTHIKLPRKNGKALKQPLWKKLK